MRVRMTAEMLDVLKQTPELPEDQAASLSAAEPHGDAFLVRLSDDEAMAMAEMCQWYIKAAPETGELTPKAKLYDSVVVAIDQAQFD
jgi:hypothetical protein